MLGSLVTASPFALRGQAGVANCTAALGLHQLHASLAHLEDAVPRALRRPVALYPASYPEDFDLLGQFTPPTRPLSNTLQSSRSASSWLSLEAVAAASPTERQRRPWRDGQRPWGGQRSSSSTGRRKEDRERKGSD